jgi:penicillin amidase
MGGIRAGRGGHDGRPSGVWQPAAAIVGQGERPYLGGMRSAADKLSGLAVLLPHLARQALRRRRTCGLEERFAMLPRSGLPIERPVTIFWNRHQVPFIEAETDGDLAVALGMVHAHLRLGQLELMRRIAQGRIAELIGSSAVATDHLLHTVDFGRAVPGILAAMPDGTHAWLDAFVRGLNHYLAHVRPLPPEFDMFAIRPQPWTLGDIVTLGRLVSADVNWVLSFQLLKFRCDADWPLLWRKLVSVDSLAYGTAHNPALSFPLGLRGGSNSFVVAPSRTANGAALLASDPHLAITLPNAWLLAAIRSPSLHAAGLMIPGLPFIALGRNPWIAWGGTSLHAASSDLVHCPEDTPFTEREVEVPVRWGRRRKLRLRDSRWGPVITDTPLLASSNDTLALRWIGHSPSDEITAMLAVNRARNWREFISALEGFAVPGQNMTYADVAGHIGHVMAVHLPRRPSDAPDEVTTLPGANDAWKTIVTGAELPSIADPEQGFITSANERPRDAAILVGRHFSRPDRKHRLDRLLSEEPAISAEIAAGIQQDVHSAPMLTQCRQILEWLRIPAKHCPSRRVRRIVDDLAAWDGYYHATSRGALVFEVLCQHLARAIVPARHMAAYRAAWGTRRLIWDEILAADPRQRQRLARDALHSAARSIGPRETWGSRHRLRLGYLLGLAPVVGRFWRYLDLPVSGSSDTLMKTAHALTASRHGTPYGSMARQICDLSDLDRNRFVLLGGQDGWLGSTTFLDQVALWQRGEYIILPLRPETARAMFPLRTELRP